jgi:hypothetical protein
MSETVSFRFSKGEEIKDSLSGFTGTVIYQVSNLTGCSQYGVEAKPKDKAVSKGETHLIDENRLVSTGKNVFTLPEPPPTPSPKTVPARKVPGPDFKGKPAHPLSNKPKIK